MEQPDVTERVQLCQCADPCTGAACSAPGLGRYTLWAAHRLRRTVVRGIQKAGWGPGGSKVP